MRKRIGAGISVLCLAGFFYAMAAPGVAVTVTAVDPTTGSFAPKYEIVMWIQNAAGDFIKTFGLWGHQTTTTGNSIDLPIWGSHLGTNAKTVDGVSSATLSAGATVNATWNLTNASGAAVPNGTYTYNIELSNHHSTTAAYSDWYARGEIIIDGTSKTATGTDSAVNTASTYITNVSAVYTAATSSVIDQASKQKIANPFAFVTPSSFTSGTMSMKLISPNGQIVWQKNFQTSRGESILLKPKDIALATRFSGIGILVADYGAEKISRRFVQTK